MTTGLFSRSVRREGYAKRRANQPRDRFVHNGGYWERAGRPCLPFGQKAGKHGGRAGERQARKYLYAAGAYKRRPILRRDAWGNRTGRA